MEILDRTWIHKSTIFQAVIFELLLIRLTDTKGFQGFVILQLKTSFAGAILQQAQDLEVEHWSPNETSISAYALIVDFWFTYITFVLDLDEIDLYNESTYFDDVAYDLISRHCLEQLDRIVGGKIIDFFFYSSNDFQIILTQL